MKMRNLTIKHKPKTAEVKQDDGSVLTGLRAYYVNQGMSLWTNSYTFLGQPNGANSAGGNSVGNNLGNISNPMRPQMQVNTRYATASQDIMNLAAFKGWAANKNDSGVTTNIKNQLQKAVGLNGDGSLIRCEILPTILDSVVSKIVVRRRQVHVIAQDKASIQARLEQVNRIKGAALLAQKMQMPEIGGLLPQEQKDWALMSEKVIAKGVNKVINDCINSAVEETSMGWNGATNGMVGAKVEVTPKNGLSVRAVDILQMVFAMPTRMNCKDLQAAGEVRYMSIAELKQYDLKGEYTEDDWKTANNFASIGYTFPNCHGVQSDRRSAVLDFEFIASEEDVWRQSNYGMYPVEQDYEPKDPKSRKVKDKYGVLHRAMWVINTNIILSYGVVPFQTRGAKDSEGYEMPELSFKLFCPYIRSAGQKIMSLVARAIPMIQKAEICMLNFLYELAVAKPSMYTLDLKAMQEIFYALGDMSEAEVQTLAEGGEVRIKDPYIGQSFLNMGVAITTGENTINGVANNKVITQKIEGGISTAAANYLNDYMILINQVRDVMGTPRGTDGTLADPNQPVASQEAAIASSQDVLGHIAQAIDFVWEDVNTHLARAIPQIFYELKRGGIKSTVLAEFFDEEEEKLLAQIGKDMNGKYKFIPKKSPTTIQLQKFEQTLDIAIQAQTIDPSDKFYFMDVALDDLQSAIDQLKVREKQKADAMQANQIAVQQENAKGQLAAVEAAAAAKLAEIEAEGKAKEAVEVVKGEQQRLTMGIKVEGDNRTQVETAAIKTQGMVDSQYLKNRQAEIIADKQMEHEKEISAREKLHETVMSERDKQHEREESDKERKAEKDKPKTKSK